MGTPTAAIEFPGHCNYVLVIILIMARISFSVPEIDNNFVFSKYNIHMFMYNLFLCFTISGTTRVQQHFRQYFVLYYNFIHFLCFLSIQFLLLLHFKVTINLFCLSCHIINFFLFLFCLYIFLISLLVMLNVLLLELLT